MTLKSTSLRDSHSYSLCHPRGTQELTKTPHILCRKVYQYCLNNTLIVSILKDNIMKQNNKAQRRILVAQGRLGEVQKLVTKSQVDIRKKTHLDTNLPKMLSEELHSKKKGEIVQVPKAHHKGQHLPATKHNKKSLPFSLKMPQKLPVSNTLETN